MMKYEADGEMRYPKHEQQITLSTFRAMLEGFDQNKLLYAEDHMTFLDPHLASYRGYYEDTVVAGTTTVVYTVAEFLDIMNTVTASTKTKGGVEYVFSDNDPMWFASDTSNTGDVVVGFLEREDKYVLLTAEAAW